MIIGVDPGTEKSAWVMLNHAGLPLESGEGANAAVLHTISEARWVYDVHYGIEDVRSYGMPIGKDTIETIWWSGRFYEKLCPAESEGKPGDEGCEPPKRVHRIPRKDIVVALCGNARAGDRGVRDALLDLYPGGVGTKASPGPLYGISGHKWAALAVAVHLLNMVRANDKGEPNR